MYSHSDFFADFGYALRRLSRERGFTLAAVACLALGIGANTAIFTVVNGVLLRQLPFDHPDRVVHVWQTWNPKEWHDEHISAPELRDYQAQSKSAESVAGYITAGTSIADGEGARRLQVALVTPEFFAVTGVRPALGRAFTAEEATVPGAVFAVISAPLWNASFARDPGVIGRDVVMNGRKVTIVGVMPEGFAFPEGVEMWRPLVIAPSTANDRSQHFINALARLKPGVTVAAASAEFNTLALGMPSNTPGGARVVPALDQLVGPIRPALMLMLAAVALVLLVACGNVANLMLARAVARRREMAVRTALGASSGQILRQLLTESVTLAIAGAVAGLLLALWAVRLLVALGPPNMPRIADLHIDGRVLAFTAIVSIATGILFGLAPALSATRVDLNESLKETRALSGRVHRRFRNALVVLEIALSLVLLVGASLLTQTIIRLRAIDTGFRSSGVLTARVSLPGVTYQRPEQRIAYFDEMLRRIRALPGVVSVGATSILPISNDNVSSSAIKEGASRSQGGWPEANVRTVTPDYFETLGIRLVSGRYLTETDGADSLASRVVVVNQALAERLWPGENPLGKRFSVFAPPNNPAFREVVGVVADVRQMRLDAPARIEAYEPFRKNADGTMSIVVRASGDPTTLAPAVRQIATTLDRTVPIFDIRTMDEQLSRSVASRRFNALLLGVFSVLAIVLASVGLFGVVSYTVGQRTGEIGVRMALGADAGHVRSLVLGEGLKLALVGVALGALGAFAGVRVLEEMLYGVKATDPTTFVVAASALTLVAALASYLPARRASRIAPTVALRAD